MIGLLALVPFAEGEDSPEDAGEDGPGATADELPLMLEGGKPVDAPGVDMVYGDEPAGVAGAADEDMPPDGVLAFPGDEVGPLVGASEGPLLDEDDGEPREGELAGYPLDGALDGEVAMELKFPVGEVDGPVPEGIDIDPGAEDAGVASALLDPAGEVAFPAGEDELEGVTGPGPVGNSVLLSMALGEGLPGDVLAGPAGALRSQFDIAIWKFQHVDVDIPRVGV